MKFSAVIATFVLAMFSFIVMLNIKSDVKSLSVQREQLLETQRLLLQDIQVQQAEYAHLTNPERLRAFAIKYGMQEIKPRQVMALPAEVK